LAFRFVAIFIQAETMGTAASPRHNELMDGQLDRNMRRCARHARRPILMAIAYERLQKQKKLLGQHLRRPRKLMDTLLNEPTCPTGGSRMRDGRELSHDGRVKTSFSRIAAS
jgi:hypothetical protein